jgi:hypothetical protein
MNTLMTEPAQPLAKIVVPLACGAFAIYLFFVALAMETYLLLVPTAVLFGAAVAPALKLLVSRRA